MNKGTYFWQALHFAKYTYNEALKNSKKYNFFRLSKLIPFKIKKNIMNKHNRIQSNIIEYIRTDRTYRTPSNRSNYSNWSNQSNIYIFFAFDWRSIIESNPKSIVRLRSILFDWVRLSNRSIGYPWYQNWPLQRET